MRLCMKISFGMWVPGKSRVCSICSSSFSVVGFVRLLLPWRRGCIWFWDLRSEKRKGRWDLKCLCCSCCFGVGDW